MENQSKNKEILFSPLSLCSESILKENANFQFLYG
jgi:hypothetical protein